MVSLSHQPLRHVAPLNDSSPVYWAFHCSTTSIEHMRVDHRRPNVAVAEQLLHRAYVVAFLDQVSREAMSECVTVPGLAIPAWRIAPLTALCSMFYRMLR